jgi:hypothetical protein
VVAAHRRQLLRDAKERRYVVTPMLYAI